MNLITFHGLNSMKILRMSYKLTVLAEQSAGTDKRTACYSDNWPAILIESVRKACSFRLSGCLVPSID